MLREVYHAVDFGRDENQVALNAIETLKPKVESDIEIPTFRWLTIQVMKQTLKVRCTLSAGAHETT